MTERRPRIATTRHVVRVDHCIRPRRPRRSAFALLARRRCPGARPSSRRRRRRGSARPAPATRRGCRRRPAPGRPARSGRRRRASSTTRVPSRAGSGSPKRPSTSSQSVGRALGERHLEPRLADLRLERGRGALGDDAAAGDDRHPVGELVGLLEVLGRQEDGGAVGVELLHLLPDRLAADGVEPGRRLVQEEHAGLVDERRGEIEPPLHAARVGADPAVGGLGQPDPLEQRLAARRRPRRRGSPCSVACSCSSSRPVISGSSAASCRATPIERRTAAASSTTS